jgi:hypothetical protein
MALVRNGRTQFQTLGFQTGAIYGQNGNFIKGGLKNRFFGGFSGTFSAYPSGYLASRAMVLPEKGGAISSYTISTGSISPTATLVPAYNLEASSSMAITLTNAQLDQIVSAVASGTLSMSVVSAILAGAAEAQASGASAITVSNALCGAIFSVLGSGSMTVVGSSTLTALANMSADAGGPTPLSPEGLANAVWDSLASNHLDSGTMGAKVTEIQTELAKKLSTKNFIALK